MVKLGSGGALLVTRGRVPLHSPANAVPQVLDPVGAGDAFCAGFIDGVLRDGELDFSAALAQGNACGAAAVAAIGDIAGLPTTEFDAFALASSSEDITKSLLDHLRAGQDLRRTLRTWADGMAVNCWDNVTYLRNFASTGQG